MAKAPQTAVSDEQTGLLGFSGGVATSSIMVCKEPGDRPSRVARAVKAALAAAVDAGSVSRVAAKAGSSRCLSHSAPHDTSMGFTSVQSLHRLSGLCHLLGMLSVLFAPDNTNKIGTVDYSLGCTAILYCRPGMEHIGCLRALQRQTVRER